MAGRPATAQGGQSGLLYWVIVFAILMVASLGLFIFQLTSNQELIDQAQSAQRRLQEYGSPPQYYADEARQRNTRVFSVMDEDRKDMALLVTGVPDDVGAAVLAKSERVMQQVAADNPATIQPTDTLLTALQELNQRHNETRQLLRDAEDARDTALTDLQNRTQQLETARATFSQQVADLQNELAQVREGRTTALTEKEEQLQQVQSMLDARAQELQQLKREGNIVAREKDIEIIRLTKQIGRLQEQIQALKPSRFDPNAILTQADGRILRAVPGSDVVYINLGESDGLKPGMGFEVFSQTPTGRRGLRGKASLEVVTTMGDTSECRVKRRVAERPIIEGDIVVNIAFDRERKPKFVIRGQFDLDYDDQVDPRGAERIANLVREWGGQVVAELDETVDYVVIGQAPGPYTPDDVIISDIVRDQVRRQELANLAFFDLLDQAASMYIPIITQNQFLYLIADTGEVVR